MDFPAGSRTKIAFVHVPKTAGTSLTTVLAKGWGRVKIVGVASEVDAMPDEEVEDLTLIAGHFFPHQMNRPCFHDYASVTVLRDPFDRLVSAWRFAHERVAQGDRVGPAMAFAAGVSFSEFAFSSYGAYDRHSQVYNLARERGMKPQQQPMARMLRLAKRLLDGMLVGTADRLDDFARALFHRFDRGDPPPMPRLNTTADMPDEVLGLSPACRAALIEILAPDYELLAYGRGLMEAQLAEQAVP
ncbi:sulfotransferase family 2 domain-containing protein [Roseomonas rosulenta]|uniref:sulfotransferase family 2 domain-containing protein n=1 Tax=Roseomonas rosulenta TaxID=2748667 RepID=UPI0018E04B98|nr:sulfotransferase family 2 domain-containing protein [Roseomonas rosulenta]